MRVNKKLRTNSKEEILQALAPLNQYVLYSRERYLKALTQRDYVIDEDGSIRWSPFLLSGKIKEVDKSIEEKVKEVDLIKQSKKFMDSIEYSPVEFHLEIIEFCDGFQVNLSTVKTNTKAKKNKEQIASISYFIWKYY